MAGKISELTAASSVADADQVEVLQSGVNKRATSILFVTAAKIATALGLTASRAVVTNGSGALAASSVTATELGYVSGVTSAIQTQLNAKPDTGAEVVALFTGTPDGTKFLRDDGTLAVAGGGGYDKLTASGPNDGILTLYDDTPTTGETRLVVREGADLSGFENLVEIQNNGGTPQWYIGGQNNDFRTYMPAAGISDANERYFRVSSAGVALPSDGVIGFCSEANNYSAEDAYFKRGGAGVMDVLTTADAPASLRIGTLTLNDGTEWPVTFGANDSGGTGKRALVVDNA